MAVGRKYPVQALVLSGAEQPTRSSPKAMLTFTSIASHEPGISLTSNGIELAEIRLKKCEFSYKTHDSITTVVINAAHEQLMVEFKLNKTRAPHFQSDVSDALANNCESYKSAPGVVEDEIEDDDPENKALFARHSDKRDTRPTPSRPPLIAKNSSNSKPRTIPLYVGGNAEPDEYFDGAPSMSAVKQDGKSKWDIEAPPSAYDTRDDIDRRQQQQTVLSMFNTGARKYQTLYNPARASPLPRKPNVSRQGPLSPSAPPSSSKSSATASKTQPRIDSYMDYRPLSTYVPPEWTGIQNVGNSCYIGATIRALTALGTFMSDLGSPLVDFPEMGQDTFYRALLAMTDLVLNPNRTSKVDPTPVKKAIGKYFQMFAGGQQQDAHEFFLNCVMKVEDELYPLLKQGRLSQTDAAAQKLQTIRKKLKKQKGKKLKEKSEKKEDDDATKHALSMMLPLSVLRTMDCPTKRNFSGVKLQSLRCTGCGQVRFRKESFRSLELDVFSKRAWKQKMMPDADDNDIPMVSLDMLLQSHFADELVQLPCDNADCKSEGAILSYKILRLPRILVLHLKRFTPNFEKQRYEKITTPIKLEHLLDLQSYCTSKSFGPILFPQDEWPAADKRLRERIAGLEKSKKSASTSKPEALKPSPLSTAGKLTIINHSDVVDLDNDDEVAILPRKKGAPPASTGEAKRRKTKDDDDESGDVFKLPSINKSDRDGTTEEKTTDAFAAGMEEKYADLQNIFDFDVDSLPATKNLVGPAKQAQDGNDEQSDQAKDDATADAPDDDIQKAIEASRRDQELEAQRTQLREEFDGDEEAMLRRAMEESMQESKASFALDYPNPSQDDAATTPPVANGNVPANGGAEEENTNLEHQPDPFLDDELLDDFPEPPCDRLIFDLSEPIEAPRPSSYKYTLQSMIHHIGVTTGSGHYVTDACESDGKWIRQDDAKVYKLDAQQMTMLEKDNRQSTAYLLFYVHEDCQAKTAPKPRSK